MPLAYRGALPHMRETMPFAIDLTPHTLHLVAIGAAALVILALAARIPLIGGAIRVLTTIAMVVVLVLVLDQRGRFDPYLGRVTQFLQLDTQKVSGREVRIRMSADGHFWARARIGGVERRMLIDSGATVTALSERTAAAAGVVVKPALFPIVLRTANGAVQADTGEIAELRLGNITARNLAVVVSPAFGDADTLGMNFLSRLKSWRVEGRTLILVPHHPQAASADEA